MLITYQLVEERLASIEIVNGDPLALVLDRLGKGEYQYERHADRARIVDSGGNLVALVDHDEATAAGVERTGWAIGNEEAKR